MKVCIPTMDEKGLEGMPSAHFGSAPFFTFVDTESGEVEAVGNGGGDQAHGQCQPVAFLGTRPVGAVLCRGVGRGALMKLQAGGVRVFITMETDVKKSLDAFEKGILKQMTPGDACQGHSHGGHGHGQGGHGQGGHGQGVCRH